MTNYKNLFLLTSVILIFACLFFCFFVSETSSDLWSHTYGGSSFDWPATLASTPDGGYVLAGETYSSGAGNSDCWLIKTDAMGNVEWNRTYGEEGRDNFDTLVVTSDGGYILTGSGSFGEGEHDFWLIKTDAHGNIQWSRTPTYRVGDPNSMIATSDGGYALCGSAEGDFWFAKLNSEGHILWIQTYGGEDSESAESLVQTDDGGFVLAGFTDSFGAGDSDFWLVKIDQYGEMEWNRTYGEVTRERLSSIIATSDGGYIMTGSREKYSVVTDHDILVIKIDSKGNIQWNQTYGRITYQDTISKELEGNIPQSIMETDWGYIILGRVRYDVVVPDAGFGAISLLKIDKNGNKQWAKTYGENEEDAVSFVKTADGGYAILGRVRRTNSSYDFLFFNVDSKGNAKKIEKPSIETPEETKTIVVPDDYSTILDAVGNASEGDTVFVKKGIYDFRYAQLTIDKPLSLIGEDPKNTIIKGIRYPGQSHITQFITIAIECPNVTVSGFTLTGGGVAFRVETAIYSPGSIKIIGNNIQNYTYRAFGVYSSNNVLISKNSLTDINNGFSVLGVRNCTLSGNTITARFTGIEISESVDVTVKENKILECKQGLDLGWCGPYQVYNNTLTNNQEGLRFVRQCDDVNVYKNDIMYNDVGIVLENKYSQGRTVGSGAFYQNNCVENLQQIILDPDLDENDTLRVDQADSISWNKNGKGNYWSDYTGADNNENGIGDSPYVIDQNIQDKYPLMDPTDLTN